MVGFCLSETVTLNEQFVVPATLDAVQVTLLFPTGKEWGEVMTVGPISSALAPVMGQVSRGEPPTTLRTKPPEVPPANLKGLTDALPSPAVGDGSPEALEIVVARPPAVAVLDIVIAAKVVALPDLDPRAGHRAPVRVENAPADAGDAALGRPGMSRANDDDVKAIFQ